MIRKKVEEACKMLFRLWSLTIIAVVFYLLDSQNLFVCDDFRYAFVQGDNRSVNTLFDAMESQVHAYKYENGRFLVHTIVQCFAGFGSMEILRLFNTFFFIVMILGIEFMITENRRIVLNRNYVIFIVFFSVLLAIPVMGYSFLGNIACSVNYLWTASLSVCFFCLLNMSEKHDFCWKHKIMLILFSIIVGSMQESFSIGISVGILFSMLIRINKKCVNKTYILLAVAYCIGAAFVILAPSNFVREAAWNENGLSLVNRSLRGICSILLYCHTFLLMCITMIIYVLFSPLKAKAFLKKNLYIFIAIILSVLFVVCVAFTGPHQLVSIELFSLILILKVMFGNEWMVRFLQRESVIFCGSIILLIMCCCIGYYRYKVKQAYGDMILSARLSTDGCMIGGEYDFLSFSERNWFVKNYTSTELNQNVPLKSLSMYLSGGKNEFLIKTRLPQTKEAIVRMCFDKRNKISENTYKNPLGHFYVVKLENPVNYLWVNENVNWMSALRERLLNCSSDVQFRTLNTTLLDSFLYEGYIYYIVYNNDAHPIMDVVVNKK